jgi:hypothetical protein
MSQTVAKKIAETPDFNLSSQLPQILTVGSKRNHSMFNPTATPKCHMEYLGQQIEISEQKSGWVGIWWEKEGVVQLGFFPTASAAWQAIVELIQRDLAIRSLLSIIAEWRDQENIAKLEYELCLNALAEFIVT